MTTDLTYTQLIRWLSDTADADLVTVNGESALVSLPLRLVVQASKGGHREIESPAVMLSEIMHQLNLCRSCTEKMIERELGASAARLECWEQGQHKTPYPRREVAA